MKLPALLTSDLHLTANPRDEYRWLLFDWLVDRCRDEGVKSLVILGDLTDSKDYHPASLTNRMVAQIKRLRDVVEHVFILMGNHDYLRTGHAYFDFLNALDGVTFITKIHEDLTDGVPCLFLPHTKSPSQDWEHLDTTHFDYVFMHQTVGGALASNGQAMVAEGVPDLSAWCKVYSGDIHVPQIIKRVEYVGSPYHVHFGDNFKPRCILIDRRNRPVDLHYETVSRRSVKVSSLRELKRIKMNEGDHVKLTLRLDDVDKHAWNQMRRLATAHLKELGVEVHDVKLETTATTSLSSAMPVVKRMSDDEEVLRFVQAQDLGGDVLDTGLEIVG